jgi:hypothetical protein
MLYAFLFLTALLSQLSSSDAAASSQTRTMTGRGSMDVLNNLVVIGNSAASSNAGDISFSMYTYAQNGASLDGVLDADDFVEYKSTTTAATTPTAAASGDLAGNTFEGLGHDVAIADESTVFVSQTSLTKQTGRVVVYEGNVTTFSQKQLLIPYDGKHRQDSSAAFGESIAATPGTLAAGCQNCNSSAPIFSGGVYVYKANKEGRWSESQVLSADGVLFLGEKVAMHGSVIVAAGDDKTTFTHMSSHNFDNIANTVVVFEEKGPKFEQRQIITPKAGGNREEISGVAVFDETIAITTKGSDTGATETQRDKVYIYYPMNKRYGLEPKGKPAPQQWTNIQILTSSNVGDIRYIAGAPDTSISGNELRYLTTTTTNTVLGVAKSIRSCLSCKFSEPVVTAKAPAKAEDDIMLDADANSYYGYAINTALTLEKPETNSNKDGCLNIQLIDQYEDGWGIASLVVTSPDGREDKYTIQCDSANPMFFKYCPSHYAPGKYNIHIDKGEETPYGWEIYYRVAAGSTWYAGDRHTHMDFLWDAKYQNFVPGASRGVLPQTETCKVCDPNKPAGKRRSLSNLRSLHHKGTTSSPTVTLAPTIVATGQGNEWNEFKVPSGTAWFVAAPGGGTKFMISDPDGKKLIREGTTCYSGVANTCWVDLPDGDYLIRVGTGISGATVTWTFCGTSNMINGNSQFQFSVVDQQCYVGAFHEAEYVCKNIYKSTIYYLELDLLLSGGSGILSASDESNLNVALTETMMSVVGTVPSSSKVTEQTVTTNGVELKVMLQFESSPDATALDNFVKDTSSASSLLKYELIGTQSLAAKFLDGGVSSVSILSAATADVKDFSNVDESSYNTVTDHVWLTASSEQSSNNFNEYAKYVAEGAYALVAVAAVLAVSLFIKRAIAPKTSVSNA